MKSNVAEIWRRASRGYPKYIVEVSCENETGPETALESWKQKLLSTISGDVGV